MARIGPDGLQQAVFRTRVVGRERAALARDPRWAQLTMIQILALSTLDPEKRDALQQENLW